MGPKVATERRVRRDCSLCVKESTLRPMDPSNVAIGFATGRKAFQRLLRTYIRNWQEAGFEVWRV